MVRLLIPLLLLLLVGCQQTSKPIALDELAAAARAGDASALKQLIGLLGEAGERTNDSVYALLLELGDKAVPLLLPVVRSEDRVQREYVIAALGNLKTTSAVPAIAEVLADTRLGRRYVAAWALGEIGSASAVNPLLNALGDQDAEVRKYATRSLIKLNRLAVVPLIDFLRQTRDPLSEAAAVRALGDIADPQAFEILMQRLDGGSRAEVVTALGKLKDTRTVEALISVLHDPAWRIRMNAAMALGPVGTAEQAAKLETLLEDEVNVVREWAARSLETMTGKRYTYRNEAGEYVQPYSIYH
jgi:HEAT repeat protein